ncbi:hypothetical protein F8388_008224 [Cannabis sativa]|uniref:Uncharacterized protein n=1 Tax=Cannabis sativa TaxID=3483 RepID=A0A7J6EXC7_CANSA|nr:hypothetical protein F8388_008224 [Cannabis sativa]KAF4391320.1 hypothetical protein G4B88_016630 [Cannabis sativa]
MESSLTIFLYHSFEFVIDSNPKSPIKRCDLRSTPATTMGATKRAKVKQAFCSTGVDLPPEESTAPYHYIILPETFDLNETRKVLTVSTGFRIPIVSLVDSTMPSITTPRSPISSLPTITFSLFISSMISLPRPFFFIGVLKEGEVEQ